MIQVTKSNGTLENFQDEKVLESMKRSGVPADTTQAVMSSVKKQVYNTIPTSQIYKHINQFLQHSSQPFAQAKYSLKEAMMQLGPTGYPFEDFVATLLRLQGFATQTRQLVYGACVTHEIDVIATKNTVIPTKIMVEAKYHNTREIQTNIHVSLYTYARFLDSKEKNKFTKALLITNTKATMEAITYAQCVGMDVVSWSYPTGKSLRDMIEKFSLYPITTLSTLSVNQKQILLQKGVVLCSDLCKNPALLEILALPLQTRQHILEEARFICSVIAASPAPLKA